MPSAALARLPRKLPQQALESLVDPVELDGLGQVLVHAGPAAALDVVHEGVGRHGHDGHAAGVGAVERSDGNGCMRGAWLGRPQRNYGFWDV